MRVVGWVLLTLAAVEPPVPGRRPPGEVEPAAPRRIVILGSSTANGAGASSYSASWAGLLTKALASRGVQVINRSISGANTEASLLRFDRDVAPLKPDFVVLATSPTNEWIYQLRHEAADRYLANTRDLLQKVARLGAVAVLAAPSARNGGDADLGEVVHRLHNRLERLGAPMVDFLGPVEDCCARYLPGLSTDGIHMNDEGHLALFDSTVLGLFEEKGLSAPALLPSSGLWAAVAGSPDCLPLQVTLQRPAFSWTLLLRYHASSDDTGWALRAGPFLLEKTADDLQLSQGGEILGGARKVAGPGWHLAAISYQRLSGRIRAILDGEVVLEERAREGVEAETRFGIWGAQHGFHFASLSVHRSPLPVEAFRGRGDGSLPIRSLEAFLVHWTPPQILQGAAAGGGWMAQACPQAWAPGESGR